MTLVTITRQEFQSLGDERLSWVCIEPVLLPMRGKDMSVKTQTISQLSKGQQALCMFRIMFDHAKNSVIEYYCWISYLLDKPALWSGVPTFPI